MSQSTSCPCGSGCACADCCGRYHAGESAPTAEALMRSRYSAFVVGDADYLRATWHPDTCPADLALEKNLRWVGLELRRCEGGTVDDSEGVVEFVARYKANGRAGRLHETSRFVKENGRWFYRDGSFVETDRKAHR